MRGGGAPLLAAAASLSSTLFPDVVPPFASAQTTAPTVDPLTSCPGEVNLCIAIDHSGSLCSHVLSSAGSQQCNNCPSQCQNTCRNDDVDFSVDACPDFIPDFDQDTCCFLFSRELDVAKGLVEEVVRDGRGGEFSVVGFSTEGFYQSSTGAVDGTLGGAGQMTDAAGALAKIDATDYQGGFTNHADAIEYCQSTFQSASDATRSNVILIVTDGVPTRPGNTPNGQAAALAAKSVANAAGTYIRPLFYNPYATAVDLDYMNEVGNDPAVIIDAADIQSAVEEALYTSEVLGCPPPAPTPDPLPDCGDGTQLNVCLAIDHSGSLCSHSLSSAGAKPCNNCAAQCQNTCRNGDVDFSVDACPDFVPDFDRDTCCYLFSQELSVIDGVVQEIVANDVPSEFSVVGFSTEGFYQTYASPYVNGTLDGDGQMTTAAGAVAKIQSTDYQGGFTNHAAAIEYCQSTFQSASAAGKNIIIMITDGVATRPTDEATGQAAALAARDDANSAGTFIRMILYNPYADRDEVDYVNALDGTGEAIVLDAANTQAAIDEAVYSPEVLDCPAPTMSPTVSYAPTEERHPCYPDYSPGAKSCLCDGNEPKYMRDQPAFWLSPDCDACCESRYPWAELTCKKGCGGTVPPGDGQYFVDASTGSCKRDCGPGEEGSNCDVVPPPVQLYESAEVCCSEGQGWVDLDYCVSRSVGIKTGKWVVDWDSESCGKDCDPDQGAPCVDHDKPDLKTYPTAEACCARFNWKDQAACIAQSTSTAPGGEGPTNKYYVDYDTGSCLRDCEEGTSSRCKPVPPPIALFDTIASCCEMGLNWVTPNFCLSRSVGFSSNKWVVDFGKGRCGKDCDPDNGSPCMNHNDQSAPLYDSVQECCERIPWVDDCADLSSS